MSRATLLARAVLIGNWEDANQLGEVQMHPGSPGNVVPPFSPPCHPEPRVWGLCHVRVSFCLMCLAGFQPMMKAIEKQGSWFYGPGCSGRLFLRRKKTKLRKARFAVESGQDSNSVEAQSAGFPAQCASIIAWSCATPLGPGFGGFSI